MRYHNITKEDMLNGDGLRVVLWVSGCSHHCPGCHNPITWDPQDGLLFDEKAKEELFAELSKDYISGITFSGGDPMFPTNKGEIYSLARELKQAFPDKTIWLYTGSVFEDICKEPLMQYVDVCVDGEFILESYDAKLRWKGSANQRVINVKETLKKGSVVLHCEEGV